MQDLTPSFKSYGPGKRIKSLFHRRLTLCQDFLHSEFPGLIGAKPLLLLGFLIELSGIPGDLAPKWAEKCQEILHFGRCVRCASIQVTENEMFWSLGIELAIN